MVVKDLLSVVSTAKWIRLVFSTILGALFRVESRLGDITDEEVVHVAVLLLEEAVRVQQVVLKVNVESISFLDQEAEHVRLLEDDSEVKSAVVSSLVRHNHVLHWGSAVVLDPRGVLNINVEHRVEVLFDESQVHTMTKSKGGRGVALDRVKLKRDVGEVKVFVRVDLVAEYLHHAVVWELDDVRIFLLYDDLKVVVVALIPNRVG